MAARQIVGGGFQAPNGAPLALGSFTMRLNTDAVVSSSQLAASRVLNVPLDANGNVSGTVLIWPNDQLNPSTTVYVVKVYTANGQLCWGPHQQTVPSGGGTYDISNWVPLV
jgi:hypothetical protein